MISPFARFRFFRGTQTELQSLLKELMATLIYDITRSCYFYLEAHLGQFPASYGPAQLKDELIAALLDEITLGMHKFFDLSDVGVLLVDQYCQQYRSIARQGVFSEPLKPGVYNQPFGVGLIGRAHTLAQTVLINDTSCDPDMHHVPGVPILSELLVPVKFLAPGGTFKVLAIFDVGNLKRDAFSEEHRALVEIVAEVLAPVLYDPLTYLATNEPALSVARPEWNLLIRTLSFMNTYLTASRQRSALQISQAAGVLAESVADQAVKAVDQVQRVEATARVAEEVSRAAKQIASETHELSRLGRMTAATVATGQEEVSETARTMQQLALASNQNAQASLSLLRRLDEIRQVGALLEEIGEETNLLALNATIEASGAGALGQRFGVVATEVRGLAERVKMESRYIRNLLQQVVVQGEEFRVSSAKLGNTIIKLSLQLNGASNTLQEALDLVQRTEAGIEAVEQLTEKQEDAGATIAEAMLQAGTVTGWLAQEEAELAVSVVRLKEIAARLGS